MLKVGITGGVASGKSTLARLVTELGAAVRDADTVVEELYRPGRPGARAVEELFGRGTLANDGSVDRSALAALILTEPAARRRLEEAVHPLVRKIVEAWFAALARSATPPEIAVVEAALLVETGAYRDQDRLVVVSASDEVRRSRALESGWPADKFTQIVAAQLDDAAREAVADYVVHNDGDLLELGRAARELWSMLREDARLLAVGSALPARRHKGQREEGKENSQK
jgi:dephospho-CoA kinase